MCADERIVDDATMTRAVEILRCGGIVAFPTETVYGLGANAFDAEAVARIFEAKKRPRFDPLIVHVRDDAMLATVAAEIGPNARKLIERFWPGPLTLVFPKRSSVPDLVTAGLAAVAVRMPSHAVARELLRRTGLPLAAPSANPFGFLSPTQAAHVARMLGDCVDLIVDGGPTSLGVESTILVPDPVAMLLRPGALPLEEIEAVVGPVSRPSGDSAGPAAPGRLPRHYSPATPIRIVDPATVPVAERAGAAVLAWRSLPEGYAAGRVLSPAGDLREAAAHLFERLHELDALRPSRIDAEPVPERGLGLAIADRLRRAAGGGAGF
ncbi:MAG TPA: L-threonylcarbamoyladenylate synthase [Candidatus Acidoferrales bacterium]|nr:L-threonylcarbamoyladenylate synthase [Candidatus Acidoferrales bacterium]